MDGPRDPWPCLPLLCSHSVFHPRDSLRCSPCPRPSELQGATCPHLPGLTLFSPRQAQEDVRQQLREFEETKKQIEEDEDREIQDIKTKYEKKLRDEKEANLRLKGETGIMRKKVPGWFLRGTRGNPGPTAEKAWGGWTDTESANSGSAQGRGWCGGRLAEFPPECPQLQQVGLESSASQCEGSPCTDRQTGPYHTL